MLEIVCVPVITILVFARYRHLHHCGLRVVAEE